jgi:hypothetical protein
MKKSTMHFDGKYAHGHEMSAMPGIMLALLCVGLFCSPKQPSTPDFPGGSAIIFEHNGDRPASGAMVKIFETGSASSVPVSVCMTDNNGSFSINELPTGLYCIQAEKDSFVLLQDSIIVANTMTTLRNDTLECQASLSGTVLVKPDHDPRTVTLKVLGTGRAFDVTDINGGFLVTGLAQGNYTLRVSSTIPEYIPIDRSIYVSACSHTILPDTIRLRSLGVPIVSGIQVFEDTTVGTIKLTWEKTFHRDMLDYLIYREHCEAKDFVHEPLRVTRDTLSVDSIYVSLPADLSDTLERCLRYWIAVRTNGQEIGTAYRYTEWRLAPKSYIMTSLSHGVRNFLRECDSASVNDTIFASVKAWNRTRPLRSVCWWDPEKKDTVSRTLIRDRLHREIRDTIRYSFQSLGVHRLVAIAEDYAGNTNTEIVSIKIVPDIPVADAGSDTGVFTGEKVYLHGRAYQQFGEIIVWRWKIGDGEWKRISGPDTTITAPSVEKAVICSLEVIDEDGNRSVDAMKIIASFKAKSISAGSFHSIILKADGSCWACGLNDAGQLGDGSGNAHYIPVKIMSDVIKIAAGGSQSLFLKNDGVLWACGNNDSGRLGDGTSETRFTPVKIMENVQDMSAGEKHSLILKTDNTLWACGDNDSGQLGEGTNTSKFTPVQVLTGVKFVAAGGRHSLAIKTDGALWACGKNRSGQLGNETSDDLNLFTRIMDGVTGIAAGDRHSMFLKADGSLLTSGNNWYGQLGDNSGGRRLAPIVALTDVHDVGAGTGFSLAVKIDGGLWVFGKDSLGQLGIGLAKDTNTTPVHLMDEVETVTAGASHSLILKTDGSLWACGDNEFGQIGDGTNIRRLKPEKIIPPQQ